jgi:diaminopimelate decarboxylase
MTKIHIHIGSENTPESWTNSANIWLDFVRVFWKVTCLDMGGWFKKAIMPYEKSADLQAIWKSVADKFEDFYKQTWRKIDLEVEPWKYMVINSCSVIAKVDDIVNTGSEWYKFIRTNTWMTEMPRVAMYWVQQPITVMNNSKEKEDYVVVWHCCESCDILTCKLYDQEVIETISLPKVSIWDTLVIDWTWAYNSSMSMKNYNSFPEAGELLIRSSWEIVEIRKRQKLEDIWKNEIEVI